MNTIEDFIKQHCIISHNGLPELCEMIGGGSFLHLEFMKHNFGYWLILSNRHSGEETGRINIGTFQKVEDVIALVDVLFKKERMAL